jgi:AraC-like DNA-binding protein
MGARVGPEVLRETIAIGTRLRPHVISLLPLTAVRVERRDLLPRLPERSAANQFPSRRASRERFLHDGRPTLEQEPTANLQSPFDVMHFYVSRAALNEITDEQGAPRIDTLTCERGVLDPTVWHLGQTLLPALERPHEIGAMYADHLLIATHTYFAVAFGGMRLPSYSRRGGLAPWQVRCATELMIERLGTDMSLSEVADVCGLSPNYFARAFKQSVGTPPHRWLLLQRVLRAKSLLRDARFSLSDIAVACGFADQSHFTRVFTSIVGASPGAWRKQVQ